MEPEEYVEYFEDILSRTPKSGQKGCYAKVSRCCHLKEMSVYAGLPLERP